MSKTAILATRAGANARTREKPLPAWPLLLVPVLVLVVGLGVNGWLYLEETGRLSSLVTPSGASVAPELRGTATPAEQFQLQSLKLLAGTAAAGMGSLLALGLGFAWSKHCWARRHKARQALRDAEWDKTQRQLADARRESDGLKSVCAEYAKRSQELVAANRVLQQKIDQRSQTEKALTQKRLELETSKTVLEVHVQARTQELQRLQHRYEMILNSAGEGICGLDSEGKATFVNPAVSRMTGWQMEELVGRTEQEIFGRNGANGHEAPASQNPGEEVFRRKDGSPFPVECTKTPINENGRVVGAVVVFKDIAERRRTEDSLAQRAAELTRSNAELEQFAFVASHDLQEPLRKIQAFGDRLKLKCGSGLAPDTQDYLERMQGAAARMRTLIDDLLAFSRAIRSTEPFVRVDLGTVTREVLGDLEVRIEKGGARVEIGELPAVEADPTQMRQLLLNLIGNALKFQPPGAKPFVQVQARTFNAISGEALCELSVKDNGIGFDEKYTDKIFAVFQRLHGRNEYEGSGVGLAVCRRIVDRHHGTIQGRSQPGEGATFVVTLPMHQNKPDSLQ